MSPQAVHQVDVFVSFLALIAWFALLLVLEKVSDPRVRWVRLASFGKVYQAYERLPGGWGVLHGVLVLAALLCLGTVLVRSSEVRRWLLIATAGCLLVLATAWAVSPQAARP